MITPTMIERYAVGKHCIMNTTYTTLKGWVLKNDGTVVPKPEGYGQYILLKDGGGTFTFSPSNVQRIWTTWNRKEVPNKAWERKQ